MRRPLLIAALASLLAAPAAAADWVRIESPNFVVFGEIGEKRTREYAAEFERFREAIARVVPGAATRPAAPAVVFIFKDARSFQPYLPLYNEGARRSTFYAQSWALVHMLLNGEPNRSTEFNEYVRLTAAGRSPLEAWQQMFGEQKIGEQLRRYVRQAQMKGFLFSFDREITSAAFHVSTPAPADAHAALADLRLHVAPATVAEHMARAPAEPTAFTTVVRGLIKLEEGKQDEALPLLLEAACESDDWLVQYRAAIGLERIASASPGTSHREATRAANAALLNVMKRKPDLPHAIAIRALIVGPGDEGVALIRRARRLAPGRTHYAIWQAQYHSVRGEFASARELLAPLMSLWFPQETRDYARSVMAKAVTAEQARTRAAHGPDGGDPAASLPRPSSGLSVPLFRELQPGEQRIEASFERVECPRDGLIVHLRIAGRPARYAAESFDAVEFLSYRDGREAPIQCGPRVPPDTVYLTWRPSTGQATFDGVVVAVELLPR